MTLKAAELALEGGTGGPVDAHGLRAVARCRPHGPLGPERDVLQNSSYEPLLVVAAATSISEESFDAANAGDAAPRSDVVEFASIGKSGVWNSSVEEKRNPECAADVHGC